MPTYYSQTTIQPGVIERDSTAPSSPRLTIYPSSEKRSSCVIKNEENIDEEKEFYRKHVLSR
jgi:hypothetical protein